MIHSKFFGGQNGQKAEPQQAKLKFSSKAGTKNEKENQSAAPGASKSDPIDLKKENDDDDMEMKEAKPEESDADVTVFKKETSPPSSSKKRSASTQADEDDEDEEPPTKKARKPVTNGVSKKGVAKKTATRVKVEPEPESNSDEEPATKSTKKAQPPAHTKSSEIKSRKPNTKRTVVPDNDDDEEPVREMSAKKPSSETKSIAQEEDVEKEEGGKNELSGSEAESEVSEEEDEIKPEQAAKAREKVQSTLKATSKDAYPDWKVGDPVPYAALCTTFSKIELTTKRLEILALCSAFLRQVARLTPQDLLPTVLLMNGKLAADYSGIELGIGESLIMKAIGESTGRSLKIIKEDQQKIGDLGLVAAKSRQNQPTMFKPKPLTVRGVHEGLMKIATVEGQGSQGRKVDGIKKLLSSADVNLPTSSKAPYMASLRSRNGLLTSASPSR